MKRIYILLICILFTTSFAKAQVNNCAGAMQVVVNGACAPTQNVSDVAFETTANNAALCGTAEAALREGWYTFQATGPTATVTWTSGRAPALEVFSGTCGALVQIGCADAVLGTSNPQTETVNLVGLTAGNWYLVRVINTTNNNITGGTSGTLCVTGPVVNDNPCTASSLPVSQACNYSTATNAGATVSAGVPAPGCGLGGFNDVWFSFVVPPSGNVVLDSQTGTMVDGDMAVYSGPCAALALVACDDFNSANGAMASINLVGQTPGATLYVRMWGHGGVTGSFGICVSSPANNPSTNCNGAYPVCASTSFSNVAGGFGVQELNAGNQGCILTNENQTTWFAFSPQAVGTIELYINPLAGAIDYDFAIWGPYNAPTCPVTGAPLRCSYAASTGTTGLQVGSGDNTEPAFPAMTPRFVNEIVIGAAQLGKIYYLMVDNFSANGTPFVLDWALSDPTMLDCTFPLPVEVINFSAEPNGQANNIHWSTTSEINNNYFVVEKSSDALNYTELGRVDGAGNSNTLLNYHMQDLTPFEITYYKLRQVDQDGTTRYYGPAVVYNNNESEFSVIGVYPNPADISFFIDVYSKDMMKANVSVYNSFGQTVYNKVSEIDGNTKLEIASDSWVPGVYIVKVINDDHHFQYVQRVIIK